MLFAMRVHVLLQWTFRRDTDYKRGPDDKRGPEDKRERDVNRAWGRYTRRSNIVS